MAASMDPDERIGVSVNEVPDRASIDDETAKSWESEQNELKKQLIEHDTENWETGHQPFSGLERVGGVDISFVKTSSTLACVSLIVCSFPELEVLYEDCHTIHMTQPYISGFLAFREVPFFLECLDRLKNSKPHLVPQIIFVDGNGILHARGFGTACHLGVLSGIPTVGIAKKLSHVDNLQRDDQHEQQVSSLENGGDSFDLIGESGKVWGKALRSCEKSVNPIYLSVGHRISLETATSLVRACCRYRIPEPVRQADIRSREFLRVTFPEHYPASAAGSSKKNPKSLRNPPTASPFCSHISHAAEDMAGGAEKDTKSTRTGDEGSDEGDEVKGEDGKSLKTVRLEEMQQREQVSGCACS